MSTEDLIFFRDEVLLASWSDTSRNGQTVTFRLPELDVNPFKACSTGKAGKRFMCVLVEIGDDEKPVVQEEKMGGALSREAAGMCKRDDFQRFLERRVGSAFFSDCTSGKYEDMAAHTLRVLCGVSSRAEFDHNPAAAARFTQLKREFLEWQR